MTDRVVMAMFKSRPTFDAAEPHHLSSTSTQQREEPASLDSIFIDDDEDGDLEAFDDDSFTVIHENEIAMIPAEPETDARLHLQEQIPSREPKAAEKMKNKIMSFWNNVKYGWSVKPKGDFKKRKPIFLLGKCYTYESDSDESEVLKTLIKFKQDFTSRIWLTYRQDFQPIHDSQITSDGGWGCMLRSGQMMLAHALTLHRLGRDWNMFVEQTRLDDANHREIIRWFADAPSQMSPFSLHRLVSFGGLFNKKAGDWYGPSTVALILEKACQICDDFTPLLNDICLYVAHDCTLYKEDVLDLAMNGAGFQSSMSSENVSWRSVIIIVPVRLGAEHLNPIYIPCIKGLFLLESFLGIIGGKPKHSLYFVGFQDSKLIHLDPHLMQDVVETFQRDFPLESYHCGCPRKLSFTSMDPSCALGFYCHKREDFDNLLKVLPAYLMPPVNGHSYPLFTIDDGSRISHHKNS